MKWLLKKRQEVLKQWKEDKISYNEAVAQLVQTGMNIEKASQLVAKT